MKEKMDKVLAKKTLTDKVVRLRDEAKKKGVSVHEVRKVFCDANCFKTGENIDKIGEKHSNEGYNLSKSKLRRWINSVSRFLTVNVFIAIFLVGIVSAASFMLIFDTDIPRCVLENNELSIEMTRPMLDCDLCRNLYSVPIEHGISEQAFKAKYAYSSVPVLIKDVTSHWTAMSNFSFQFFKQLYEGTEGALKAVEEECQFFPYKTDFSSLGDVFNMSEDRANFVEGQEPWYIGWSNCHKEVREELRKHYERPYFLPTDSESSTLDWIFMGGSGPGALIHIDYVQKPSWQAQISGKKTWTLLPPPECEAECRALNITVHKGDIFVVDTNLWYHSTFIHPGEISITIGSEYD